jgi:hypothetical protein
LNQSQCNVINSEPAYPVLGQSGLEATIAKMTIGTLRHTLQNQVAIGGIAEKAWNRR